MKIVQLCPYDMDRPGGVQRHVRDLTAWLNANGHETRILCPPAPGAVGGTEGFVTRLGRSWMVGVHGTEFEISRASTRAVRNTVADLRDWGADLVHMHTPWTPFLVSQLWRGLRLPTAATVHATLPSPDAGGFVDRYIRWSARRILPQCGALVVPSPAPLDMLRRLMPGIPAQVLPPCIDLSPWRNAPDRRADAVHLVFLGRLEPRKGLRALLRAWPRIAECLPEARLTIAGDGPLQAEIGAAASDRLTHLGRPDDEAARALLASADLLLAPAPYGESFGLVLAEAMAAGVLPVAAANPGYASVLAGEGAALLVPPDDSAALAEKVVEIARSDRTGLQAWARRAADDIDIATQGPRYLDLYQAVVKNAA